MLAADSHHSSSFERIAEHVFLADVLQEVWYRYSRIVQVLRYETDNSGVDLVLECNGVVRHVQLKSSRADAKTREQKVHLALGDKPSGCVIWMLETRTADKRMKLNYLFFGGKPGKQLPLRDEFKTAKHSRGNAAGEKKERPSIRIIPKNNFKHVGSTTELVGYLFGLR